MRGALIYLVTRVPNGRQVSKGPIFSWCFKWRVKHSTLKRACSQPKQVRPLPLSWLIWSCSRKGKKKKSSGQMSDVQQQPESEPTSQEFRCEELGPDDVEIDCWGPILMPFACKRKKATIPTSVVKWTRVRSGIKEKSSDTLWESCSPHTAVEKSGHDAGRPEVALGLLCINLIAVCRIEQEN